MKPSVIEGSILGPNTFPIIPTISFNDLPDNVICNVAIYVDDTPHYSKCD